MGRHGRRPQPAGQGKFQPVKQIRGTVRTLRQTSDGALWIGSIGHGLYRYANGDFSHWTSANLLPSNTVLSIFEDAEQQVWLGTQEGMVRLSKTPVSVLPLPGDSDPDIGTISADPNGTIWAVSSGVFAIRDGVARAYKFPNLPDVPVRNVFRDRAGDLWIGTDGSGVYRLTRGGGVIHYTAPGRLTNNFVRAFLQSRDGAVWIATDEGVSRIDGEDTRRYEVGNGLAYFSTRALLEDSYGDIWIGTDHGLSHLHAGAFVRDAATAALAEEKGVVDSGGRRWSFVVWHPQPWASPLHGRKNHDLYDSPGPGEQQHLPTSRRPARPVVVKRPHHHFFFPAAHARAECCGRRASR